jgi:hypothetical protein
MGCEVTLIDQRQNAEGVRYSNPWLARSAAATLGNRKEENIKPIVCCSRPRVVAGAPTQG